MGKIRNLVIFLLFLPFIYSFNNPKLSESQKETTKTSQPPSKSPNAAIYHAEGLKLFYNNKYEEAINIWLKELDLAPNNSNTMRNIGIAYANLKDYKTAKEWYYKAIKISPNFAQAHNSLAIALFEEKNYSECEKAFKEVIKLFPDFPQAHFNLGNCYSFQNKHDIAIEEFFEHLKQHPEDFSAAFNIFTIVDILIKSKKYDDAQKVLLNFSKIPLKLPETHRNTFNIHNKFLNIYQSVFIKQDYPEIIKRIEKLIPHLNPNDDLWVSLNKMQAYSYLAIGKRTNSIKIMKKLINSHNPKIDTVSLVTLIDDLTKKEDVSQMPKPNENLLLKIDEDDLGINSDVDIVGYDFRLDKDSFLDTKIQEGRIPSEDKTETTYIRTINKQISRLGFHIYNLKALKDENRYYSYDYDLFQKDKLIVPNMSFPGNFTFDKNKFIFKTDQRINPDKPPENILIDTGKVKESYIYQTLWNGKILGVATIESTKTDQLHFTVADGANILYDFYVPHYLGDVAVTSFFTHDNHWVLEHYPNKIVIDGQTLNESKKYTDILNYRYLNEKLFYIFRDSSDKFKVFYGDSIYPVEYERIMNNGCCSAATYNPTNSDNMVSFFAVKNNVWYHVKAVLTKK